ncbi:hypothetical protein GGS24DRAFT_510701 [Hypoxylon argillaceum]|nr:hypothetical protein GGS24DRAFT_510701 [Hypoxylon argillaceum]
MSDMVSLLAGQRSPPLDFRIQQIEEAGRRLERIHQYGNKGWSVIGAARNGLKGKAPGEVQHVKFCIEIVENNLHLQTHWSAPQWMNLEKAQCKGKSFIYLLLSAMRQITDALKRARERQINSTMPGNVLPGQAPINNVLPRTQPNDVQLGMLPVTSQPPIVLDTQPQPLPSMQQNHSPPAQQPDSGLIDLPSLSSGSQQSNPPTGSSGGSGVPNTPNNSVTSLATPQSTLQPDLPAMPKAPYIPVMPEAPYLLAVQPAQCDINDVQDRIMPAIPLRYPEQQPLPWDISGQGYMHPQAPQLARPGPSPAGAQPVQPSLTEAQPLQQLPDRHAIDVSNRQRREAVSMAYKTHNYNPQAAQEARRKNRKARKRDMRSRTRLGDQALPAPGQDSPVAENPLVAAVQAPAVQVPAESIQEPAEAVQEPAEAIQEAGEWWNMEEAIPDVDGMVDAWVMNEQVQAIVPAEAVQEAGELWNLEEPIPDVNGMVDTWVMNEQAQAIVPAEAIQEPLEAAQEPAEAIQEAGELWNMEEAIPDVDWMVMNVLAQAIVPAEAVQEAEAAEEVAPAEATHEAAGEELEPCWPPVTDEELGEFSSLFDI